MHTVQTCPRTTCANIAPAPSQLVEGVIYEIQRAEIEELDILEDVPLGLYRRDGFLVLSVDMKWHRTELYRVVTPEGTFPVSERYLADMIAGATEHRLSKGYIEKLTALRT